MRASRSSKGRKADFIALMVNQRSVAASCPKACTSDHISSVIEVPLISRLSVLTVTRKRRSVSNPIGCSATEDAAPVWTLLAGQSSSGMRLSRTYAASRPSSTEPSSATVMSSTMRTPWPSRSAPHHCSASQIDGVPKASPAWMVKWKFSRWRYSKASRWRVGG